MFLQSKFYYKVCPIFLFTLQLEKLLCHIEFRKSRCMQFNTYLIRHYSFKQSRKSYRTCSLCVTHSGGRKIGFRFSNSRYTEVHNILSTLRPTGHEHLMVNIRRGFRSCNSTLGVYTPLYVSEVWLFLFDLKLIYWIHQYFCSQHSFLPRHLWCATTILKKETKFTLLCLNNNIVSANGSSKLTILFRFHMFKRKRLLFHFICLKHCTLLYGLSFLKIF